MKRLKLAIKNFFYKAPVYFSFGEMDKDRFCKVLKDGEETKCRMYMWDPEDCILRVVKRLEDIDKIHCKNGL